MLKAIVQEKEIGPQSARRPGGLDSTARDDDDDSRQAPRELDGFIPSLFDRDARAVAFRNNDDAGARPAVPSGKNRRTGSFKPKPPSEELDEGGLSRAAHRDVAHRHDRASQPVRRRAARRVPAGSLLENPSVERGQGRPGQGAARLRSVDWFSRRTSNSAVACTAPRLAATKAFAVSPLLFAESGSATHDAKSARSSCPAPTPVRKPCCSPAAVMSRKFST